MSVPALRTDISRIIGTRQASNPGLSIFRFQREIDGKDPNGRSEHQNRELLVSSMLDRESLRTPITLYEVAYRKWEKTLEADKPWTIPKEIKARDRLFIGLGGASVLEFGVSLHPVYGLPMIPGSALKGVCARYADEVWGETEEGADWANNGELHRIFFGNPDDGKISASAGAIDFLDAWWTPGGAGPFVAEIINPHHPDYYVGDKPKPPADWDSPIPVKMLAVAGSFLFAVRGPAYWNGLAMTLLKEALAWDGIGGKTRAGYGRFGTSGSFGGGGSSITSIVDSEKTEEWPNTHIKFHPNNGMIIATGQGDFKGKKAETKDKGIIPEKFQKKLLKKKQAVTATVLVSSLGNASKLIGIKE